MAAAEHPVAALPAGGEFRRLVGHRGHAELRIAEAVHQRRDGEVRAGAPGRQDQIDLVLGCQPLDGADQVFVRRPVVILDDLDHPLRSVRHGQSAGGVDVLDPQFIVRDRGDAGAGGIGSCLGNGVADFHGFIGGMCQIGAKQHGHRHAGCQRAQRGASGNCHEFSSQLRAEAGFCNRLRPKSAVMSAELPITAEI